MKTNFTNRKRIVKCIGVALAVLLLGVCPAVESAPGGGTDEKIIIRGSNTIGEELAPALIAEYKKIHPSAAFEVEAKATGYGLAALRAGRCDIAGASREATKQEMEEAQNYHIQMKDYIIGSYSVAVTVNVNNPITKLTKKQVSEIFTGAIRNWKDVGGPNAAINLYIRDPISGTYLGFRELAMENKAYGPDAKLMTNYEGIVDAVAQDAHGIGYSSIELATHAGVKGLFIGGVPPTEQSVNAGKYPYFRVLHFYTNKTRESGPVREFADYVVSPNGQRILATMGFVPHP